MDRFVFPRSFYDSIKTFKPVQRDALYSAIFGFMFDDEDAELGSLELQRMWMLISPILSKAKKISNTKSEQYKENVRTMSGHGQNIVKTKSEPCSLKEKDKEKDIRKDTPLPPQGNSVEFDKFWNAYPRHVAKQATLKAFERARTVWKKDGKDIDFIINAIERQKKSEQWTKDNGQFIPYPATWLNQGRWDDGEIKVAAHEDNQAPFVEECPICHGNDLYHSLGRYKCNSCNLVWDWNAEDRKWEVTL